MTGLWGRGCRTAASLRLLYSFDELLIFLRKPENIDVGLHTVNDCDRAQVGLAIGGNGQIGGRRCADASAADSAAILSFVLIILTYNL